MSGSRPGAEKCLHGALDFHEPEFLQGLHVGLGDDFPASNYGLALLVGPDDGLDGFARRTLAAVVSSWLYWLLGSQTH